MYLTIYVGKNNKENHSKLNNITEKDYFKYFANPDYFDNEDKVFEEIVNICNNYKSVYLYLPEIYLNVDLQYILIDTIQKQNPKIDLIIFTLSPSIFGNGWNDKIVFLDNL